MDTKRFLGLVVTLSCIIVMTLVLIPEVGGQTGKRKRDKAVSGPRGKTPARKGSGVSGDYCKGDRGCDCDGGCGCGCVRGTPGPAGPPGQQGIQGIQGVQGVQGANGVHGVPGSDGNKGQKGKRGFKGQKGEPANGSSPPVQQRHQSAAPLQVAFSVTMDTDMAKVTEYRVVKYNIVNTNLADGYDIKSGVFTSPVNGTYVIGFSGVSYHGQNILLHLVKNGQRILSAFDNSGCACCAGKSDSKCAGSGSNVGILGLEQGDKVWIELPDDYGLHNALYHSYASFYGYMIYQHGEPKKIDRY